MHYKCISIKVKKYKLIALVSYIRVDDHMANKLDDLSGKIVSVASKCSDVEMIAPLKVGEGGSKNELIFFIKPEIFMLSEGDSKKVVDLIIRKFEEFGVDMAGTYCISGSCLDKHNIMARHYGFINVMSTSASKLVDDEGKRKIAEAYGLGGKFEIMGGHEYLKAHPSENVESLDKLWFAEKSVKIRSGFYVRHLKEGGKDIILVNGFHPKQLAYFTDPSHKIVLMLLHSNNEWGKLKNLMVGATFPDKADAGSIRGVLYKDAKSYGFESVTIANNCVHLSAGPFEGMFEIFNFFGKITTADLHGKEQPLLLRKMMAEGIEYERASKALDNPKLEYAGKQTDLFSATEDMDTDKAIALFKSAVK